MSKPFSKHAKGLLAAYLGFLILWLCWSAACFGLDRAFGERALLPEEAALSGVEPLGENKYLTTNEDPQMVFENIGGPVRKLVLLADFQIAPGEMALYYAFESRPGFSARRVVYGKPVDGGYEFTLPPWEYGGLRLDPGAAAGNTIDIQAIALNPAQPFWRYFVPSLRGLLAFALVPALAYCAFCIIIETIRMFFPKGAKQKG